MKVLLINPSSMPHKEIEAFLSKTSILRIPTFRMPLGLLDLSAYLKQEINNLDLQILDMAIDIYKLYLTPGRSPITVDEFIKNGLDAVKFTPDIVGISIMYTTAHNLSLKLANAIKKRWHKATIICGGVHASNYVVPLLLNPNIDYVVRGEGELSFTEFIKEIQNGKERPDICGFINQEKLRRNQLQISPMISNLDDIPLPDYSLLDIETYRKESGACVMFSRGCPYYCTFCAAHTVHGRRMRFRSPDNIIKNIEHLVKIHRFTTVKIEDDLFGANKKDFIEIGNRIKKLNYPNITYELPNGVSPKVFNNEDMLEGLNKLGIKGVKLAIESGSPFVQQHLIKKNLDLIKTRNFLKILRKRDYFVEVNFILGFSKETLELMQETINYIKTLDVDWVYIFTATPLPGSEMFERFVSRDILSATISDCDNMRFGKRSFNTPEISAEDLENLAYDTNIDVNYFNNSNMRHKRYERAIGVFSDLIKRYPFHIITYYCRALCYMNIGQKEKGLIDLRESIKWISINNESKKLYNRYEAKMPELKAYYQEQDQGSIISEAKKKEE